MSRDLAGQILWNASLCLEHGHSDTRSVKHSSTIVDGNHLNTQNITKETEISIYGLH